MATESTLWLCQNSYWKWWFSSWIDPLIAWWCSIVILTKPEGTQKLIKFDQGSHKKNGNFEVWQNSMLVIYPILWIPMEYPPYTQKNHQFLIPKKAEKYPSCYHPPVFWPSQIPFQPPWTTDCITTKWRWVLFLEGWYSSYIFLIYP